MTVSITSIALGMAGPPAPQHRDAGAGRGGDGPFHDAGHGQGADADVGRQAVRGADGLAAGDDRQLGGGERGGAEFFQTLGAVVVLGLLLGLLGGPSLRGLLSGLGTLVAVRVLRTLGRARCPAGLARSGSPRAPLSRRRCGYAS